MLQQLRKSNIKKIRNPVFSEYARRYQAIYDNFAEQVSSFGLPFGKDQEREIEALRREISRLPRRSEADERGSGCTEAGENPLCQRAVTERNNGASLVYGNISGACAACREGVGSYTGFISLMCHRDCYYCFNPNQENFETFSCQKQDWSRELEQVYRYDKGLSHIALTGGEPLLHKKEMIEYFQKARNYWPGIHMRLYTSGDLLDVPALEQLKASGLDEIRFSLKLEDTEDRLEQVYRNMELAKAYIPCVMVEMPVLPDKEREMREVLDRLERIGIFGINLLEFCFPFVNGEEFRRRGYALRYPPYKTLYNFWYAGGLPVAGSEVLALKLLKYAVQKGYGLNVHYCSLENKHFGQIYAQNAASPQTDPTYLFSQRDFYLKTVKAFGRDARRAEAVLREHGARAFRVDEEYQFIQLHPSCGELLRETNMELGISYNVKEYRDREEWTRELRLDYVRAGDFRANEL